MKVIRKARILDNNFMRSNLSFGIPSIGVVLRSWVPEKKTCLVFDKIHGVIKGVLLQHDSLRHAQHGAMVSYELVLCGERIFFQQVRISAEPALWAKNNLAFVHHVLEMCAVFVPPHMSDGQLFDHVVTLYSALESDQDPTLKRLIFLVQFFLLVGWYPDEDVCAINRLISRVSGTMVTLRERESLRDSLIKWLRRCVALHPMAPSFKTVTFFEVVGYYES